MSELLSAAALTKSYSGRTVVENVSLTLRKGELVGLVGMSGGGKTTVFNMLSGLTAPDSGRVLLRGKDITGQPGNVSYMLQKDLLFGHMKVIDCVALPLVIRGMSKKDARETAGAYFGQFGLEGTEYLYPAQLSGGMRQRAALLRTRLDAVNGVALLDEPFGALDAITREKVREWYLGIMQELDLSTVFITHDVDEAVLLSDRVLVLSGSPGRIAGEVVIAEPKPRKAGFGLTTDFLEYKKQILGLL
ncbi:MAG: ABC transporter ATP-binding protein [Clostridia bacterium]|nr:ABC transporter ATP-binding protein [Clostridia bacterium]